MIVVRGMGGRRYVYTSTGSLVGYVTPTRYVVGGRVVSAETFKEVCRVS